MEPQHHTDSSRPATVDPNAEPKVDALVEDPKAAAPVEPAPAAKAGDAQKTEIGSTIVIRGKLKSDEDLVVRGRIEADITSSKSLHVENSGIIKATVKVSSARVDGILVGNVTAADKLEIAAEGRVVGDLYTPRIVIREGAAFRGNIDMPNFDAKKKPATPEPVVEAAAEPVESVDIDVDTDVEVDVPVVEATPVNTPDANRGGFLGRKSKKRRN